MAAVKTHAGSFDMEKDCDENDILLQWAIDEALGHNSCLTILKGVTRWLSFAAKWKPICSETSRYPDEGKAQQDNAMEAYVCSKPHDDDESDNPTAGTDGNPMSRTSNATPCNDEKLQDKPDNSATSWSLAQQCQALNVANGNWWSAEVIDLRPGDVRIK